MKKTLIALAMAAVSLPALAQQKAPAPDYTMSANVSLVSDYRFRGITQASKKPALQGGFDFAHKGGLYLGNWNSSIDWVSKYNYGESSGIESDLYVGYKADVGGISLDIGAVAYTYAGTGINSNVPTNEVYVGLGYGPLSFKTFFTTSEGYFSYAGRGTIYYSLGLSFPVSETVSLKGSYGYTAGKEAVAAYKGSDYSVGVAVDLGDGWSLGLNYVAASGDYKSFSSVAADGDGGAVISISRSF